MFRKNTFHKTIVAKSVVLAIGILGMPQASMAFDAPTNLSEDDDNLCWQSDAPSTNIYEDGFYIGTVHDVSCFGPIFDNSVYQLVAHDHGLNNDFSVLSDPYLV